MRFYTKRVFGTILALGLGALASADSASNMFRLEIPLMDSAPVIDGSISPAELSQTVSTSLKKIATREDPAHGTTVHVGATRQGLYVAFQAREPVVDSLIGADSKPGDPVPQDDSVQVLITPTPEVTVDQYYHFAVNPYGVTYGRHILNGSTVNGWDAKASVKEGSWEAEMFIPFRTLRAREGRPTWRANFARFRPARNNQPEETTAWFNPGISLFNYNRFGFLAMPGSTIGSGVNNNMTTTATQTTGSIAGATSAVPGQTAATDAGSTMPVSAAVGAGALNQ